MSSLRFIMFFLFATEIIACKSRDQTTNIKLSPNIDTLVKGIAKDNVLKSAGTGEAGERTAQWERYEKLKKDATNVELMTLSDHKNAVVRCYSFQALVERKTFEILPILLNHLHDTAEVETFQGCIISSQMVGDYFLDLVSPEYIDSDFYKLIARRKINIDSILLYDKAIRLEHKYSLLAVVKPNKEYYNRIREIAETEKSPAAVLALARFRNKNDKELIKNLFQNGDTEYYGIYSIKEFPDDSFYPLLTKVFEKEWDKATYDYPKWRILLAALAKYPSEITYKLFERIANSKDEFRYQTLGKYLLLAITKSPYKIFEPLKSKIKLDEYDQEEMNEEMEHKD